MCSLGSRQLGWCLFIFHLPPLWLCLLALFDLLSGYHLCLSFIISLKERSPPPPPPSQVSHNPIWDFKSLHQSDWHPMSSNREMGSHLPGHQTSFSPAHCLTTIIATNVLLPPDQWVWLNNCLIAHIVPTLVVIYCWDMMPSEWQMQHPLECCGCRDSHQWLTVMWAAINHLFLFVLLYYFSTAPLIYTYLDMFIDKYWI